MSDIFPPPPLRVILGSFAERHDPQDWHRTPVTWVYGDNQDGSFFVHGSGNPEYFPTETEARIYARKRSQGSLHLGALLDLMARRVKEARTAHTKAKTEAQS